MQRTFEFGEGGVRCVLVSKSMDDRTAAKVMGFFLAAYKVSSNLSHVIRPAAYRVPQEEGQPSREDAGKERLLAVGKKLFTAKCGSCHDADGSKPLRSGEPLNRRKLSDEVIAKNVAPRLCNHTDEEKRAVAAYIRSFLKSLTD